MTAAQQLQQQSHDKEQYCIVQHAKTQQQYGDAVAPFIPYAAAPYSISALCSVQTFQATEKKKR